MIFFDVEYFFKGWNIANYKLSNCPVFNGNSHEPLVRNLIIPYLREMNCVSLEC